VSTTLGPDVAPVLERAPGFPATLLALVERGVSDDDVAYTGALLDRALVELDPAHRTITVFPSQEGGADATLLQRGVFAARLIGAGRRADCVLYNHLGVATAQASLLSGMRRPYAVLLHGAESWDEDIDAGRRRALTQATLRLASSTYTARRVAEAHADVPPADVLPLALLPERDTGAVDGALVSSITPRTIVIASRMAAVERFKGHDELLEAWPTILGRRPDARLAVVGRGDDMKRLESKANGLGLAGSVRFTGAVSEATLDAMLTKAGGFALPSRAEGFSLAYLRAMRAAVPCIGGADDAAREVVEDGVTGMLVPAADRDAIAQAVINLLGDTVRRRAMGEAGRERYAQHFSFARFRDSLDGLLRRSFPPHRTT
jgi:phosphatidylinositol alpha-1,6-mannosyltransferase